VISERDSAHAEFNSFCNERIDGDGSVQNGIIGMIMEMYKLHGVCSGANLEISINRQMQGCIDVTLP
jgi:hypothetical protein